VALAFGLGLGLFAEKLSAAWIYSLNSLPRIYWLTTLDYLLKFAPVWFYSLCLGFIG